MKSSIAVFLVLGGGAAYAAKKIGSNELQGNSVTTAKIEKNAVTASKIKSSSITTVKIAASRHRGTPGAFFAILPRTSSVPLKEAP